MNGHPSSHQRPHSLAALARRAAQQRYAWLPGAPLGISIFLGIVLLLLTASVPYSISPPQASAQDVLLPWEPDLALPSLDETQPFTIATATQVITVELGQRTTIPLSMTNSYSRALRPVLYPAQDVPAPGVVQRQMLPPDLRSVQLPDQPERVDPEIARQLAADSDGEADFLIFLGDQPDLSRAYDIEDWGARGQYVYQQLFEHANRSQRDVRAWLEQRGLAYRPLWIANALAVRGSANDLQALAGRADIAMLRANYAVNLYDGPLPAADDQTTTPRQPNETTIAWHIDRVNAPRVWEEFGISGQGVTVAHIDSGVFGQHPALQAQYRGARSVGALEHTYNWYDPAGISDEPSDILQHGTHVLGLMVGRGDGTGDQPAVGVAPGAQWIAARGCRNSSCFEADLIEAAQWLLAPTDSDGDNPRPDLRPHIINNSWAGKAEDTFYISYVNAWRAAGIFPVFVVGNTSSNRCSTVVSPGEYANVLAVGSTNSSNRVSSFSGTGPTVDGRLKPELMAPGESIISTFASGSLYGSLRGTSMAAPQVSGAVALLWSANPTLIGDYDATYALLTGNALPITDDAFSGPNFADCPADGVPNNIYGYGLLDTYRAVADAQVMIPWLELPETLPLLAPGETSLIDVAINGQYFPAPGTYRARVLVSTGDLSQTPLASTIEVVVPETPNLKHVVGSLRDARTGDALYGTVTIANRVRVSVSAAGTFTATLPLSSVPYAFEATVPGYVTETLELRAATTEAERVSFRMVPDVPTIAVETMPVSVTLAQDDYANRVNVLRNTGSQPLSYTVQVPPARFGVWRSDEPDSPRHEWLDLPASAPVLALEDDNATEAISLGFTFSLYGQTYREIYIGANGLLTFAPPPRNRNFLRACLPIPETDGPAIVPLRTDLDPSQGGQVRAMSVPQGFVVSYEDVPLHSSTPNADVPRFSFQVLLMRDGRIQFRYGNLGDLPGFLSVGVQENDQTSQIIGCGDEVTLTSNTTLELRPQPSTREWLSLPDDSAGLIAPDNEARIRMRVRGLAPGLEQRVYRGTVQINSNDPLTPTVRIPVELTTERAPHQLYIPTVRR